MSSLIRVCIYETRVLFRNRQALFFTFFFPVLMLVVFSVGKQGASQFLLPGLVGMVALSGSMQIMAPSIGAYKTSGIWRRVKCSPIPMWKYIAGFTFSRFVLSVAAMGFLVLAGRILFGVRIKGDILTFFGALALGILCFMCFSMFLSGLFKTAESIGLATNIVVFPMLFVSNTFYPIETFPKVFYYAAKILPLSHLVDILRAETFGNYPRLWPALGVLGIWLVLTFILGVFLLKRQEI